MDLVVLKSEKASFGPGAEEGNKIHYQVSQDNEGYYYLEIADLKTFEVAENGRQTCRNKSLENIEKEDYLALLVQYQKEQLEHQKNKGLDPNTLGPFNQEQLQAVKEMMEAAVALKYKDYVERLKQDFTGNKQTFLTNSFVQSAQQKMQNAFDRLSA